MIKSQRFWLILLSLFLGIQLYVLFYKKSKPPALPISSVTQQETSENQIQQKMTGGHLVEAQGGKRDWELFSDVSISYQGRSDWDLEGVEIRFYNSELQDMVVKGKNGSIDMSTKDMKIKGDVRIESSNGYVFFAPYIEYKAKLRLIVCEQPVRVMGPLVNGKRSLQLTSVGIQIPINERKMKLMSQVRGTQSTEDGQLIRVESSSAELSSVSQTASFDGNVSMKNGDQSLKSQKALFAFDEVTKKFSLLDMKGNVELSQGSRKVMSDDLRIDFASEKLTFSGKPRLYQDEDELVGDKIIFLEGGKKVKVEKVKAKGISTP